MIPINYTERDYPEDSSHENGNYGNTCCQCKKPFTGHKRRPICKVCKTINEEEFNKLSPQEQEDVIKRNLEAAQEFFSKLKK